MSRLASLVESIVWYVMRITFAAASAFGGADAEFCETESRPPPGPSAAAGASAAVFGFRFIGGGRFLPPPPAGFVDGAWRVGTGSASGGSGRVVTSS